MIDNEREFGPQPLGTLMKKLCIKNHDLVDASPEQLTHKQVQRAISGRRLTLKMMMKLARSLNIAIWYRLESEERERFVEYIHNDLFSYAKGYKSDDEDPNIALVESVEARAGRVISREP